MCRCLRLPLPILGLLALVVLCPSLAVSGGADRTERARKFVEDHTDRLRPLEVASALAWWNANVSGKPEDFQKKIAAQNRIDKALANAELFKEVKQLKEQRKDIADATTARAIDVLYLTYLEKQADTALLEKMVSRSNKVEEAFNVFRAKVGDKELTDSQVRKVLKESRDSEYRKTVWEASKAVGGVVEPDLKELVKLRRCHHPHYHPRYAPKAVVHAACWEVFLGHGYNI